MLIVGDIVCSILIAVALILFLAFLLVPKLVRYRREGRRQEALVAIIITVLIVGLSLYAASVYMDYATWKDEKALEYSLSVITEGTEPAMLYFPVSANTDLQDAMAITSGNGTIAIDRAPYGTALMVEFTGSVVVYGRVLTSGDLGDWGLTMLERGEWGSGGTHWVSYEPHNASGPSVEVDLRFERHTYNEDDWLSFHGKLEEGWNTVVVSHERQSTYYGD